MKQREKLITAITVAVLLVIVFVILMVVGTYTGWFKHKFAHFYLSVGKTKYMQDTDVVLGNTRFDVHYVLKKNVGYTVQVFPVGEALTFFIDDLKFEYQPELLDVSNAFDIEQSDNGFVIRCRGKSLRKVLLTMYPENVVNVILDNMDSNSYFKLVVTAGDNSAAITLTFQCLFSPVKGVEIDPPNLVF